MGMRGMVGDASTQRLLELLLGHAGEGLVAMGGLTSHTGSSERIGVL
jgi:hypothetical protein